MALDPGWPFLAASIGLELILCVRVLYALPWIKKVLQRYWLQLRRSCGDELCDAICDVRLVLARESVNLLTFLHTGAVVYIQLSLAFNRQLWLSAESCWTIFLGCALLNVCIALPKILRSFATPRFLLNSWFIAIIALGVSHLLPSHTSSQDIFYMSMILLVFRLPTIFMCTRISSQVLGNSLFLFVVAARHTEGSTALWVEAFIFSFTVLLSVALQPILAQCASWKLQRDDAAVQFGTASALLRFMCDAVVRTDETFCLEHSSPPLAAMLCEEEDTLEGKSLMELMPDVEVERTRGLLDGFREHSGSELLVNAFHTRLLNSFGNYVSTEVLMVMHEMSDKQQHFLVGLREFSDESFEDERPQEILAARGRTPSIYSSLSPEMSMEHHETGSMLSQSTRNTNPAIPNSYRQLFLDIDVGNSIVAGTSAGLTEALGMAVTELFPPHFNALFKRLQKDAENSDKDGRDLAFTLFSFSDVPISLPSSSGSASGTMQVLKSNSGSAHVLVALKAQRESSRGMLRVSRQSRRRSMQSNPRRESKESLETNGWPVSL